MAVRHRSRPLSPLAFVFGRICTWLIFVTVDSNRFVKNRALLDKQGHGSGRHLCQVAVSCQTSPTRPTAVLTSVDWYKVTLTASMFTFLFVTYIIYPSILTDTNKICTKLKRKKLVLQAYNPSLIRAGFRRPPSSGP